MRPEDVARHLEELSREELIRLIRTLVRGLEQAYYEAAEVGGDWGDDLPSKQRLRILRIEEHAIRLLQHYGFSTSGQKDVVLPRKGRGSERRDRSG